MLLGEVWHLDLGSMTGRQEKGGEHGTLRLTNCVESWYIFQNDKAKAFSIFVGCVHWFSGLGHPESIAVFPQVYLSLAECGISIPRTTGMRRKHM